MEDENITVSYIGNGLRALDNSIILPFENVPVDNIVTGVYDYITLNNDLRIYPNPFKDRFTFISEKYSYNYLEIVDLSGRIVYSKTINSIANNPFTLNITLEKGSYILILRNEVLQSNKLISVD